MNRRSFALASLAVALGFLALPGLRALADDPLPKGTLSGRVVDPDKKPIPGARVRLVTGEGEPLAETISGEDGRFRLESIEPFSRRNGRALLVEAEGFARQCRYGSTFSVAPGADTDLGTIQLDRGRIFGGRVLDVDGMPRADAAISVSPLMRGLGHTFGGIGPPITLRTDSEGRFRTPPIPVSLPSIRVEVPGRQRGEVKGSFFVENPETLPDVQLKPEVPISGEVRDSQGRPIAGARVSTASADVLSDANGRFTIAGLGPASVLQMRIRRDGFVSTNWSVRREPDGLHWVDNEEDRSKRFGPAPELNVKMTPVAWIEGTAADVDTGATVKLEKIVLCTFERKPNGEEVLSGCRSYGFEQPEPGRFRLAYRIPQEYHLTFSAEGYEEAVAYTPKIDRLQPIAGVVARLKKKGEGTSSEVPKQTISGRVTRDGTPVMTGWVGIRTKPRIASNAGNAHILRGRTVEADAPPFAAAPIRDGAYSLDVRYQDEGWFLYVDEPGQAQTIVGPVALALNENKTMDIACVPGGTIRGHVKETPKGWEGLLWAVAFSKSGIREETRVDRDGSFVFPKLPPGEYGLKVGHDAYTDSEIPVSTLSNRTDPEHQAAFARPAEPWRRARVVTVLPGGEVSDVELELPEQSKDHH